MSSTFRESGESSAPLREAVINLYLNVKVRSAEEVSQPNVNSLNLILLIRLTTTMKENFK